MARLLLVEDETALRRSMTKGLEEEGHEVLTAVSGDEAVLISTREPLDCIILDLLLPDGDGIELLRRLHQLNPHTCILIITAYATVENAVEAFKAGAFDYIVKPVIFADLLNKLDRLYQFRSLYFENQTLRRELARKEGLDDVIGSSDAGAHLLRTWVSGLS